MSFKDMAREFMHHVPLAKFHPVLLTCLKEYDSRMLSRDISAGLTVGMVALPLAMAFGIASGRAARIGPLHRHHRWLPHLASRRLPRPDRRSRPAPSSSSSTASSPSTA